MKITYIYNSCYCLEAKDFSIIIDFYKDTLETGGYIHDVVLPKSKKIYALVTHSHLDHFNGEILNWQYKGNDIHYILSEDIFFERMSDKGENITYLDKLEEYKDENIFVKAYGSTDVGVSFYIEADGLKIFHAGDLNNWHWNEESKPEEIKEAEDFYEKELSLLCKDVKLLDIAMFPIDPRLGKDFMKGVEQFTDRISVKFLAPMHFGDSYEKIAEFEKTAKMKNINYMTITQKGQSTNYKTDKMKIKSKFDHFNFNVTDLDKSIEFYEKALGLKEVARKEAGDGSYILVYLGDGETHFTLELTWLRDHDGKYDLGDEEFHLCMRVSGDYDEIREYHKKMGCVIYENHDMGLYFIGDPDGYWIEILPIKKI